MINEDVVQCRVCRNLVHLLYFISSVLESHGRYYVGLAKAFEAVYSLAVFDFRQLAILIVDRFD